MRKLTQRLSRIEEQIVGDACPCYVIVQGVGESESQMEERIRHLRDNIASRRGKIRPIVILDI